MSTKGCYYSFRDAKLSRQKFLKDIIRPCNNLDMIDTRRIYTMDSALLLDERTNFVSTNRLGHDMGNVGIPATS